MTGRVDQLEKDLRGAVAARRLVDVPCLVAELCEASASQWKQFPPGDPRARQSFDRLNQVLDWTRVMLCTVRAGAAGELRRITLVNRYMRERPPGGHLRIDL